MNVGWPAEAEVHARDALVVDAVVGFNDVRHEVRGGRVDGQRARRKRRLDGIGLVHVRARPHREVTHFENFATQRVDGRLGRDDTRKARK